MKLSLSMIVTENEGICWEIEKDSRRSLGIISEGIRDCMKIP